MKTGSPYLLGNSIEDRLVCLQEGNLMESDLDKFKNEVHSVLLRWWEESDLDEIDMGQVLLQLVEEFCESSVEFEADFNLDDDEEES